MKQLKEKTIPIKLDTFLTIIFGIIFFAGCFGFAYPILFTELNEDFRSIFGGLSLSAIVLGGIFFFIYLSDLIDLNPIHAIGYCLRWKK